MSADDALRLSPWGQPMRMVDRVDSCVPHESIETVKLVTVADAALRSGAWTIGPDDPGAITRPEPGLSPAMVLEGMSQSAALLFQMSYAGLGEDGALPVLGYLKAAHESFAWPGDTLRFQVRVKKMTRVAGVFEATALVGDRPVARAELAMAVTTDPDASGHRQDTS